MIKTIEPLFDKAVNLVIGDQNRTVSPAERQAILFEFVKYQLSQFIIHTLNPETVNFTCKDGIDRGGVHTLWFDFRQRMERGEPMSENEFRMQLDAPALLVKARPANDHRNLIWNAVYHAIQANPKSFEKMNWVVKWLKENKPSGINMAELYAQFPELGRATAVNETDEGRKRKSAYLVSGTTAGVMIIKDYDQEKERSGPEHTPPATKRKKTSK